MARVKDSDTGEDGREEQTRLRVAIEQHCVRWCELIPALRVRFRLLGLLGLLFVAFGPSYSWLLLHLLYGEAWSSTEAPDALAAYCVYVLLMAINGAYAGKQIVVGRLNFGYDNFGSKVDNQCNNKIIVASLAARRSRGGVS